MPDVVTGAMGAVSAFSAVKGADAASDANSMQGAELAMQMERDAFNKEQVEQTNEWTAEDRDYFIGRRDRERDMLDPVQQSLVDEAQAGPDYEGAASRSDADVTQTYGLAREKSRREEQRYGVNPSGGGRATAENRRWGNAEALAKTYGRNKSRMQEDDKSWSRRIAALGTGNMRNATPNATLQQLGVPGAGASMTNMANSDNANASAGYQLAGSLAADAVDRYDNQPTKQAAVSGGTGGGGSVPGPHDYWE